MIKNIVNEIYSFEILSSTEWNFVNKFQPNYFIKLTKKIFAKMESSSVLQERNTKKTSS